MNTLFNYKPNDFVVHEKHGAGVVLEEWGTWRACHTCHESVVDDGDCPKCGDFARLVSGRGVFDVRYMDGKVWPCHRHWLWPFRKRG